jgi:hypothetical protein
MNTCYGRVVDQLGHAARQELEQGSSGLELRYNAWTTSADEVRHTQPARIPVTWGHTTETLGEVIHLERHDGSLWAVAHVDDDVRPEVTVIVAGEERAVETPLYWSALYSSTQDLRDIKIIALALTPSPAQVSTLPVEFRDGEIGYPDAPTRFGLRQTYTRDLLFRASQAHVGRRWHRDRPIVVHDDGTDDAPVWTDRPPGGRLEYSRH